MLQNLSNTPEFLDKYEQIQTNLKDTESYNDSVDISATYLGPVGRMAKGQTSEPEYSFPINHLCKTRGMLTDGSEILT